MPLFWTRTWEALAGTLAPTPCVSCGELVEASDPPLCRGCWSRLPLIDGPACRCGFPLPGDARGDCGRCRRNRSIISRGASLGEYAGTLRDCVVALKYRGRHKTACGLAARLVNTERCARVLAGADLIVAVPLHPRRLRDRGFNQAELLARAMARSTRVPVSRPLQRTRDTPSQTDLTAPARRRNVRGAFTVKADSLLQGATVVLVDDVVTTGATLRECAATLLAGGAGEVRSITVARAE